MRILIAAGGTGGHLFPGIALAEEFLRRDEKNVILLTINKKGIGKRVLENRGFHIVTLDVEGIKGRGTLRALGAFLKIPAGIARSLLTIRKFSPDIVIGLGGYASGPMVMSACFLGIRTAIAEQNTIPGITNRILGKFVDQIFLSFSKPGRWFREKKVTITGNPIRKEFMCKKKGGAGGTNKFTILVFGGSRGAHSINSAMQNALPYLIKFKDRLRIIHQTGQDDLAEISRNYQEQAINGKVLPFIDDMASAYQAADLLICRSGATSIAEITAMGKAALLIPFPFATDNHQAKNAELLKEAGAAELIRDEDLTGELLAESISRLCHNPGIIKEMEEKSSKMGNPRAAEKIVDICYQMVSPQLDRPVTV